MNSNHSDSWQMQSKFQTTAVYTPSIIVDFMVNLVRRRIETWEGDLRELKILEPSCGPGSFLIKLYHILRKEYSRRKAQLASDIQDSDPQSQQYLPQDDPLRYNLYGIDINSEVIALAKLNLSKEAYGARVNQKPPLHLKVGDFLFDNSENVPFPFHWAGEFPEVFHRENPGFDIIIGNPPYSVDRNLPLSYREAIGKRYGQYYHRQLDLYVPFVPRALELARNNGMICYIIQHSILAAKTTKPLRKYLLDNSRIHLIVDFGRFRRKIFDKSQVQVLPTILLFEKEIAPDDWQIRCILTTQDPITKNGLWDGIKESHFPQKYYKNQPLQRFQTTDIRSIERQIKANCIELGRIYDVRYGLSLRPLRNLLLRKPLNGWEDRCFLHTRGDFIRPYSDRRPCTPQYYLLLDIDQYPNVIGKEVRKGQGGAKLDHYSHPHLLIRRVGMNKVEATYFDGDPIVVANDSVLVATPRHFLGTKKRLSKEQNERNLEKVPEWAEEVLDTSPNDCDPFLVLAVINSTPLRWLYQQTMSVDLAIYPRFVKLFPIPCSKSEKSKEAVKKAHRLLELNYCKDELFRVFDRALIKARFAIEEFYWTGTKSMSKNRRRWKYAKQFRCFSTSQGKLLKAGVKIFEDFEVFNENVGDFPPTIVRSGKTLEFGTIDPANRSFQVSHRFRAKSTELATFAYFLFLKQRREASSQANWSRPEYYFVIPGLDSQDASADNVSSIDQWNMEIIVEEIMHWGIINGFRVPLDMEMINREIQTLRTEIDALILDLWGIDNKSDRERILTEEFGN